MTTETTLATANETTTTMAPTTAANVPLKFQNLCENYATIVDDSRLFSNSLREGKCDFYFKTAARFMTSEGRNLQLKENCSKEEVNEFRFFCGGAGLTYLEQLHPDESDTPTPVSMCVNAFFDTSSNFLRDDVLPRPDCKCNHRQHVLVQNCSGFYVYRLFPVSPFIIECSARYCTEKLSKYRSLLLIFCYSL